MAFHRDGFIKDEDQMGRRISGGLCLLGYESAVFPEDLADIRVERVHHIVCIVQTLDGSRAQCGPCLFRSEPRSVEVHGAQQQSRPPSVPEPFEGFVEDLAVQCRLEGIPLLCLPRGIDHIPSLCGLRIDHISGLEIQELVVICRLDPIQKYGLQVRIAYRHLSVDKLGYEFLGLVRPTSGLSRTGFDSMGIPDDLRQTDPQRRDLGRVG